MNRAIGAVTKYCGVVAALLAWAIFAYAMSINPWFVFAEYAFSDLGGSLAADPTVYNAGMMALGTLLILYSLRCLDDSVNKLETVGGAFLAVAGVFLIFIGVYPSGTGPHGFVSYWFFAQTDLAILAWGLGLVERGEKDLGTVVAGLGLLSPMVAYLVPWPSTAMAETFGIVVMNIWVLLMQRVHV